MISIIVAHDPNFVIGKDNWMPWNLKDDLKHFKNTTLNSTIIMGRKTFEAIGRPLPNRVTGIVTTNEDYVCNFDNIFIINDLDEYFKNISNDEKVYVCGGATIYKQAFKYADELIITKIFKCYEGDTVLMDYTDLPFKLVKVIEYDEFNIEYYVKEVRK